VNWCVPVAPRKCWLTGIPVWQLTAPVPESVRAEAPSALDHTARALHSIVERLDRADTFALIACAEEALTLVPATSGARREALVSGIMRLGSLRLGEATDLAAGLRLGLAELGHASGPGSVRRVLLLTDGFTQDVDGCVQLAREASVAGMSVSTIGLGGEFQDDLLTRMADLSGGRAVFVRRPEQIPAAVAAELDAARGVAAQALTFDLQLPQGVTLRRITRINPVLAPLDAVDWHARPVQFHLGDLERGTPVLLLLELLVAPLTRIPPADARRRLAVMRAVSGAAVVEADLVARYAAEAPNPSPEVLRAAVRANIVRMQQRAAVAAGRGEHQVAARLLRSVAEPLRQIGADALAEAALREADTLEQTGQTTGMGAREDLCDAREEL
jgi:Ca-activated chloride channel family protein